MRGFVTGLLVCVLATGCSCRSPRHVVSQVAVVAPTLQDNDLLGLSAASVKTHLQEVLAGDEHFKVAWGGKDGDLPGWRLTLDIPFTRETQKEGSRQVMAEVGATLML